MKLTEGWGKSKNDSKGEDDGFKMEEGEIFRLLSFFLETLFHYSLNTD